MATDTYRAKRVSLQVWIDEDLRDRLKHVAIERHESVTEIVRNLIDAFVTIAEPAKE